MTSRNAQDLHHINNLNTVSPRPPIGDYSANGSHRKGTNSSSSAVNMSMSVPGTPRETVVSSESYASNNFFAAQYANNPNLYRSASGNISYNNHQQQYTTNSEGYINTSSSSTADPRHSDTKSINSSSNAFINNRGSSNTATASNTVSNTHNYNSSLTGPAPICENFQWLVTGDEHDESNNNDVDLLFGVSYIRLHILLLN